MSRRCRVPGLAAMEVHAFVNPCQVTRADMLRLLQLAGFVRGSWVYDDIAAQADIVLVDAAGVCAAVAWARGNYPAGYVTPLLSPFTRHRSSGPR